MSSGTCVGGLIGAGGFDINGTHGGVGFGGGVLGMEESRVLKEGGTGLSGGEDMRVEL